MGRDDIQDNPLPFLYPRLNMIFHTLLDMIKGLFRSLKMLRTHPAPVHVRLDMMVRNILIRIRRRNRCCGNIGQPGC